MDFLPVRTKMLVLKTLIFLLAKPTASKFMPDRLESYSPATGTTIMNAVNRILPSEEYVMDCIGHCLIDPSDKLCLASCFKPRGLF